MKKIQTQIIELLVENNLSVGEAMSLLKEIVVMFYRKAIGKAQVSDIV